MSYHGQKDKLAFYRYNGMSQELEQIARELLEACKLFLGHKPLDEVAHLLKLNYKDVLKAEVAVKAAT